MLAAQKVLDPSFRLGLGLLTASQHEALREIPHKPVYSNEEVEDGLLFDSFEMFLDTRASRDVHFGAGPEPKLKHEC